MIQEMRIYELKIGLLGEYLEFFETVGLPIASRHLNLAGFWTQDYGDFNEIYHLWTFQDLDQRLTARAALQADPDWQTKFLPRAREMVARQRNLILRPACFSPMPASVG